MREMIASVAFLGTSLFLGSATAQTQQPASINVCLEAYSKRAGQARYKVMVRWNGIDTSTVGRVDLAASDRSNAVWPQFRDQRLSSDFGNVSEAFVVGDESQYPLVFALVALSKDNAEAFDIDCKKNAFCSLPRGSDAFEVVSNAVEVTDPLATLKCGS